MDKKIYIELGDNAEAVSESDGRKRTIIEPSPVVIREQLIVADAVEELENVRLKISKEIGCGNSDQEPVRENDNVKPVAERPKKPNWLNSLWLGAGRFFKTSGENLKSFFSSIGRGIGRFFKKRWEGTTRFFRARAENVKNFFKGIVKYPGLIISGILLGTVGLLIKSGMNLENLPEDLGLWYKRKIKGEEPPGAKEQEEVDTSDNTRYTDNYSVEGMEGPNVKIPPLTDINHIDNEQAIILTAKDGPAWILPVAESGGQKALPGNADFLAEKLAGQLTGTSTKEILNNWVSWHNNPQEFLNFLQKHGANQAVIDWYKYALEIIQNDLSPDTWQDRVDDLEDFQPPEVPPPPTPTPQSSHKGSESHIARVEHKNYFDADHDFNEAVGIICQATGLDFPLVRGAMETLAICGGGQQEAIEMVSSYVYVPDVHSSIAGDLEVNAAAFITLPFYLLRIGHYTVKEFKRNIANWLDKREYRQMFNALARKGKGFFASAKENQ